MGCTPSSAIVKPTTWRIDCKYEDAIAKYENEGVISKKSPESEVELRVLLDDSVGLRFIMRALGDKAELMRCWAEIKEYSTSVSFRRERLNQICHKYSSLPYLLPARGVGPNEFETGKSILANIGSLSSAEIPAVMQTIQRDVTRCCFRHLHELVFKPMKSTIEYDNMYARLGLLASQIKAEDFDYISTIAEGGFGLVLFGRKKSTGMHYAMKVQPKAVLLKHFRRNPHRVVAEMQAFAVSRHPYVSSLAYAFQTQTLAVMVMPVSSCGDLRRSASLCPNGRMPFYAAEIVSALCYLHSHGIMYRDLKPANVLLHASGHIMLADFGSLADTGHVLDRSFKAHVTSCKSSSLNTSEHTTMQTGTGNSNNNNNLSVQRKYSETSMSMMQAGQLNLPTTQFTQGGGGGGGRHRQGSVGGGSVNPGQMVLFGGDFDPDRRSGAYTSDGVFSGLMVRGNDTVDDCELVGKTQEEGGESDTALKPREGSSSVNIAAAHLSSQGLSSHNSNRSSNSGGVVTRCASLVGTLAYMAPEVLIMFGKKRLNKDGYTDAVDWWSLGITLYRLLTGVDPFRPISYDRLRSIFPGVLSKHSNYYSAFVSVFGKINFQLAPSSITGSQPQKWSNSGAAVAEDGSEGDVSEVASTPPPAKNPQLNPTAIQIITQLLEFDAEKRLGTRCSPAVKAAAERDETMGEDKDTTSAKLDMEAGHKAVRNHAFFNGIDWNAIENASMPPPYIPSSETLEVLQEGSLAQIRKNLVPHSSNTAGTGKNSGSSAAALFGKSSSTGPKVSPPTLHDMVRLSGKFMWVDKDALSVVPPPSSNVNSGKSLSSVRRSISMGVLPEGNPSNNNSVSHLAGSVSMTGGGGAGGGGGSTKVGRNWSKRFWLMTGQHGNGNIDDVSNNASTSMSAAGAGAGAGGSSAAKQNPTKPGLKFALTEAQQEYFRDWQYASPSLVDS